MHLWVTLAISMLQLAQIVVSRPTRGSASKMGSLQHSFCSTVAESLLRQGKIHADYDELVLAGLQYAAQSLAPDHWGFTLPPPESHVWRSANWLDLAQETNEVFKKLQGHAAATISLQLNTTTEMSLQVSAQAVKSSRFEYELIAAVEARSRLDATARAAVESAQQIVDDDLVSETIRCLAIDQGRRDEIERMNSLRSALEGQATRKIAQLSFFRKGVEESGKPHIQVSVVAESHAFGIASTGVANFRDTTGRMIYEIAHPESLVWRSPAYRWLVEDVTLSSQTYNGDTPLPQLTVQYRILQKASGKLTTVDLDDIAVTQQLNAFMTAHAEDRLLFATALGYREADSLRGQQGRQQERDVHMAPHLRDIAARERETHKSISNTEFHTLDDINSSSAQQEKALIVAEGNTLQEFYTAMAKASIFEQGFMFGSLMALVG